MNWRQVGASSFLEPMMTFDISKEPILEFSSSQERYDLEVFARRQFSQKKFLQVLKLVSYFLNATVSIMLTNKIKNTLFWDEIFLIFQFDYTIRLVLKRRL